MGEINVPQREREAIKAVDVDRLHELVDQCFRDERPFALRQAQLEGCGLYIVTKLRTYEQSLAAHGAAKAAKKREMTAYTARRDGSDLVYAVQAMKQRVKTEEEEDQLFHVDDLLSPPALVSEKLRVRVGYRWRRAVDDDWAYGAITFIHDVDMRPDYSIPQPTRKPSQAKQAELRREKLYREWEYLAMLGLGAVKQYFREGGVGAAIPDTFQAKLDQHSRHLNNHSANFWLDRVPPQRSCDASDVPAGVKQPESPDRTDAAG